MRNPNEIDQDVLRYVHHELDEPARQDFERRLNSETDLKLQVWEARHMHLRLKPLLKWAALDDETLTDYILEEMNKAETSAGDSASGVIVPFPTQRTSVKVTGRRRRPLRWMGAAAAVALIWLGYNLSVSPLDWQQPVIRQQVDYRQPGEPASKSRYQPEQLLDSVRYLEKQCMASYRAAASRSLWRSLSGQSDWVLAVTVQEIPRGRLVLGVTAVHTDDPSQQRNYSGMYKDLEEFSSDAEALGRHIGTDLAAGGRHE